MSTLDRLYTFNDFVLIMLPLPFFICVLIYFLDKDERIKMDNKEIQKEIDHVKDLYNARKKAEEHFDSI